MSNEKTRSDTPDADFDASYVNNSDTVYVTMCDAHNNAEELTGHRNSF